MLRKTFFAKALSVITIAMVVTLPLNTLLAQGVTDRPVTQGEFAVYLVRALGLEAQLELGAHTQDYVQLLEEQGINPPGGFKMDEPLNKKDMAFIMVKATGIENRVINKLNQKSLVKKGKAVVKTIEGDVKFQRGSKKGTEFAPVQIDEELFAEDSIRTGADSSVELQIGRFGAAYIGANTEITIEELSEVEKTKKENVRIFIKQGNLVANVKANTKLVDFETRTKTTVAGVMGTIYSHSSDKNKDEIICGNGTINTFTIDNSGAPASDPKPLQKDGKMTAGPSAPKSPQYSNATPAELKQLLETGKKLAKLLPQLPAALGKGQMQNIMGQGQPETPETELGGEQKSGEELGDQAGNAGSYDERAKLARGDDDAYKAAIQALNEAGIPVDDSTGAAAAANTVITLTQITQFLEDLLLDPLPERFNNDVTPIGS